MPVLRWPSSAVEAGGSARTNAAKRPPHGPRGRGRPRGEGASFRAGLSEDRPPSPGPPRSRFVPPPDRPGPQSQSFSRSYGSSLPTSLTYIVPSTRGCEPRRPAADSGTARREIDVVSAGFSRAGGGAPDAAEPRRFSISPSLSPGEPIPGSRDLTKKRELFPGPPTTSPASFASPHRLLREERGRSPRPGSGMLTRFPFDGARAYSSRPNTTR